MIASTMVRASAKGLPLRPVGRGSMSAIIDHWASESTWNLDIWPVSQDGRYIFVRHALGVDHVGTKAQKPNLTCTDGQFGHVGYPACGRGRGRCPQDPATEHARTYRTGTHPKAPLASDDAE